MTDSSNEICMHEGDGAAPDSIEITMLYSFDQYSLSFKHKLGRAYSRGEIQWNEEILASLVRKKNEAKRLILFLKVGAVMCSVSFEDDSSVKEEKTISLL